ncbi:MAG: hypothetical protein SHS37scaffold537_37 [Phage 68_12]|nr:MAG: hypothetical protein SHS37scaffold537_37 [Phage 68_12]
MSAVVKLAGKMPGDFEVNGLDATVEDLLENPKELRAGFVVYDVVKENVDVDTDTRVPVVRVRRFEPLGKADEISETIRAAYTKAVEERTGRKALPLDIAEVVKDAGQGTLEGGPDNVTVGDF